MVCRNTLIASSAAMIEDPTLSLPESFGYLMSWHSAGAIAGKLITGPAADLLGGRKMFLLLWHYRCSQHRLALHCLLDSQS